MPGSLFVKGIKAKFDHDRIGRGGFGFVFKDSLGGTPVALKLLHKWRCKLSHFLSISIANHSLIGFLPRSWYSLAVERESRSRLVRISVFALFILIAK